MKYLLSLFNEERDPGEEISPEEMKAMMDRWDELGRELVEHGAFIAGEALQPGATATSIRIADDGEHVVTDGPFIETKEQLGGFYLLECEDRDAALEWARKVPMPGGMVEVRPVMTFEEFGYQHPSEMQASA